ncbi:MAG: hypothetical protein P8Q16_00810 [Flavobacteriales bacterium]|nr:hypothetical protein [Flavobacteriales bacterium]
MKKILLLIFISLSIVGKSQKFGDSIVFTTYSGKHYSGTIEEVDQDGYFFKTQNSRSIYLSKGEIKEYQTLNKVSKNLGNSNEVVKEKTEISISNNNDPSISKYNLKSLSNLIGLKDLIILLRDGREFTGEVQKIKKYEFGIEGMNARIICFLSNGQKYNFNEADVAKIYSYNPGFEGKKKDNTNSNTQGLNGKDGEKGFLFLFGYAFSDFSASTFGIKYYTLSNKLRGYVSANLGLFGGDSYAGLPFIITLGKIFPNNFEIPSLSNSSTYIGIGRDFEYDETQCEIGILKSMKKIKLDIGFRLNFDDPSWSTINLGFTKNI